MNNRLEKLLGKDEMDALLGKATVPYYERMDPPTEVTTEVTPMKLPEGIDELMPLHLHFPRVGLLKLAQANLDQANVEATVRELDAEELAYQAQVRTFADWLKTQPGETVFLALFPVDPDADDDIDENDEDSEF